MPVPESIHIQMFLESLIIQVPGIKLTLHTFGGNQTIPVLRTIKILQTFLGNLITQEPRMFVVMAHLRPRK